MTENKILEKEIIVKATLDDVWKAWTSEKGLGFISNKSNIELKRNGAYEWFLDLEADKNGKCGGEGSKVLAYLPKEMIAFSWTFPPSIPELRDADKTTQVVVKFKEIEEDTVLVQLSMHEWEEGKNWDEGWAYFDKAWEIVLDRLKLHFEGDVD